MDEKGLEVLEILESKPQAISAESVLAVMENIVARYPLCLEYEDDARYNWPTRWEMLKEWLENKLERGIR